MKLAMTLIAAGLCVWAGLGASAAGPEAAVVEPADARESETITAWARERHGDRFIEPVSVGFGDFTGDGAKDAIAFVLYHNDGNSASLDVALFKNAGGTLTFHKIVQGVFGDEPRDFVFSPGSITLTTTMPKPGDARCCPTGSRQWTVKTD